VFYQIFEEELTPGLTLFQKIEEEGVSTPKLVRQAFS